ncbi:hypothetical protein HAX54_034597 [Datura stramonium]|uniref:Uncharacterized protein n=1 Tax=Datura stramonium TaxID=4076 RepID=A0ABS8VEC6_DATST|nr:hypothetical protein [Datura stramonium]
MVERSVERGKECKRDSSHLVAKALEMELVVNKNLESGLKIPPRPKARRIESVRQQRVAQGLSHIPVAEALRRIRTSIGLGNHPQQQDSGGVNLSFASNSHVSQTADTLSSRRLRSRLFSRVLSEASHIIPMVDVAKLLAQRGVTVTLVMTPLNAIRFTAVIDRAIGSGLLIRILELQFPAKEAGLPEG